MLRLTVQYSSIYKACKTCIHACMRYFDDNTDYAFGIVQFAAINVAVAK